MPLTARAIKDSEATEIVLRGHQLEPPDEIAAALQAGQNFARWKWEDNWGRGYQIVLTPSGNFPDRDGMTLALPATLAAEGVINGIELDPKFGCAGGLIQHGFVIPVAGIEQRVQGAAQRELTHIALPEGNLTDLTDLIVKGQGGPLIRTQVFLVDGYYAAQRLALVSPDRDSVLNEAMRLYDEVRAQGTSPSILAQPSNHQRLQKILELEPGHFSARYLLSIARGTVPDTLSLRGSMDYLGRAEAIFSKRLNIEAVADQALPLARFRTKMHRATHPTYDAMLEMAGICKELESPLLNKTKAGQLQRDLRSARSRFVTSYQELQRSKEVIAVSNLIGQLEN